MRIKNSRLKFQTRLDGKKNKRSFFLFSSAFYLHEKGDVTSV